MSLRSRIVASVLIALVPVIILLIITQHGSLSHKRIGTDITSSDEIVHWAQGRTFQAVGLNGGYYTINERAPRISLFHFYSWGPVAPIFYGTLAHITGWQFYTPILINLAMLGLAAVVFVNLTRLGWQQISLLAVVLLTYHPLIIWAPTVFLQVLYQAVAIVLAFLFYLVITQKPLSNKLFYITIIAVVIAAMMRVTWCILLIPLFVIHIMERPGYRRGIIEGCVALLLMVSVTVLYLSWSAPFPNVRNQAMETISVDPLQGGFLFIENVIENVELAFRGDWAPKILRLQMLIIAVYSAISLIRVRRNRTLEQSRELRFAILHICNLVGIFVAVAAAYDMYGWRDYRTFAPHLLFSLLLLVAEKRYTLMAVIIALSLVGNVTGWPKFVDHMEDYNRSSFETYSEQLENRKIKYRNVGVQFRQDATSSWCNTVLYTTSYFLDSSYLLAFDDGIGLSLLVYVNEWQGVPTSQYLLLDDGAADSLETVTDMRLLLELPLGALYENLNSGCQP